MFGRKKKNEIEHLQIKIGGQAVPGKVITERRRSVRASIGKRGAVLRLPDFLPSGERTARKEWFVDWVQKQFVRNQSLEERFKEKTYQTGDTLAVGNRQYVLNVHYEDRSTHCARLRNGIIYLSLSRNDSGPSLQKAVQHLLSRVVGGDFQAEIEKQVSELNRRYFQKPIRGVRLKYNHSNWGSCSTRGYINLSTRLLFAPQEVIDYVIIHELTHLLEMNHSPRFWQIIQDIDPEYRQKEKWLKENGGKCDF
jgi:predicted metal-dependent hydrolase